MNLDFASVWELVADLVPENDALICGEDSCLMEGL